MKFEVNWPRGCRVEEKSFKSVDGRQTDDQRLVITKAHPDSSGQVNQKKKKKKNADRTVFNPLTNVLINNTWMISNSVSTIPKYHYVNRYPSEISSCK